MALPQHLMQEKYIKSRSLAHTPCLRLVGICPSPQRYTLSTNGSNLFHTLLLHTLHPVFFIQLRGWQRWRSQTKPLLVWLGAKPRQRTSRPNKLIS